MISKIAKYTVEAELGRGGFGRVYRAFDPDVQRPVAIKVLIAESDPELLKRFQVEVGATGNLRHKNIVTLYECGEESGVPYLVMELLEGETLEHVLRSGKQMPLLQKVRIMTQVAEGLSYAHSKGVIHRDVKPGNIMLLNDGGVKIMDFGIARVTNRSSMQLTREGFIVGTIPYMSPEQFEAAGKADQQTDIFAYGAIYYEFLTGKHPFAVPTDVYTTIARIKAVEPEPVSTAVGDCPEPLELLVHRTIAKDRDIRYQTFAEVILDSEAVLADLQHERAAAILAEVRPLIEAGDFNTAEHKLIAVAELDPGNREARRLRRAVREQVQRRALEGRIAALLEQSETHIQTRQFAEAVQTLEAARRLNSEDADVRARLADAHSKLEAYLRANRLVAEARRDQQNGQLSEAVQRLGAALELDPQHTDAKTLYARLDAELQRRRREQQIEQALEAAGEQLRAGRYDDALAALEAAGGEAPPVLEMRARIERERSDEQRRRRLAEFDAAVAAIRRAIESHELSRASELLARTSSELCTEPGAPALIEQLQAEFDAAERSEAIQSYTEQAREFARQRWFPEALERLDEALRRFPADDTLVALRASIGQQYAEQQHSEAIAAALHDAEIRRREGDIDSALDAVNQALRTLGEEAALVDLQRDLETERSRRRRTARLQTVVDRATSLIANGQPAEAIRTIEAAAEFSEEAEVKAVLASARAAAALDEERRVVKSALYAAGSFEQQGNHDLAISAIRQALRRYPNNETLSRTIERLAAEQRTAALEAIRERVEAAIERGEWRQAKSLIERARTDFDNASVLQRLAERLASAEQEAARREQYEAALSAVEIECNQGNLLAAENRLTAIIREGAPDNRAAQMLRDITNRRVREELERAGEAITRGDFDRALDTIKVLRAGAPPEWAPDIAQAFERARRGREAALEQERQRQETEISAMTAVVRDLVDHDDTASATAELARGRARFPGAAAWDSLEGEIQQRRHLLDSLEHARQLLQHDPSEALRILEEAGDAHGRRADVRLLLEEARKLQRTAELAELIREADALSARDRFDEAVSKLAAADQDTAEIAAARQRIRSRREAAIARRVAAEIAAARALTDQNPQQALRRLEKLRSEFPDESEVEEALGECRAAIRDAERRGAVEQVERLCSRGKYAKAAAALTGAVERFGAHESFEHLRSTIDESIERQARAPRPGLVRKPVWAGMGVGVAVLAAGAGWFVLHRPAASPEPAVTTRSEAVRTLPPSKVTPPQPAPAPPAKTETTLTEGSVIVDAGVPSAAVSLDGKIAAHTDRRGMASFRDTPGRHTVAVLKPGFHEARQAVEIRPGATTRVQIAMAPVDAASKFTPPPVSETAVSTPPQVSIDTTPAIAQTNAIPSLPKPAEPIPMTGPPAAAPPPATRPQPSAPAQAIAKPDEVQAVQQAITQVAAAFSQKNFAVLSRVWPGVNKQFADRFRDKNYNVQYRLALIGAPVVQGDSAQARATRTVETTYGKLRSTAGPSAVVIDLRKTGGRWVVIDMR